MINPTIPVMADWLFSLELPNGDFVRINTEADANGQYRVELLDPTGDFKAGLQSDALTD